MPISHLSGRARYTINLEVSALCLKRFWAKIVVKCRSFQSFSFLRSSASFEIRTPLTNASSSCPICNDLRIYLRIEQVSLSCSPDSRPCFKTWIPPSHLQFLHLLAKESVPLETGNRTYRRAKRSWWPKNITLHRVGLLSCLLPYVPIGSKTQHGFM